MSMECLKVNMNQIFYISTHPICCFSEQKNTTILLVLHLVLFYLSFHA